MMHMDPQLATITTYFYNDNMCMPNEFHHLTAINAVVKRANSVKREYDFHIQGAFFAVSEEYLKHLNCSSKLKPKHDYPMKAYHCVDEKGENPFADVERDIGRTIRYSVEFFDDAIHLIYGSTTIAIPRLSSEGCDKQVSLLPSLTDNRSLAWILMGGVAGIAVVVAAILLMNRKRRMTSETEVVLV